MSNKPEVSVIIPAYNEATYIDRLLKALSKQNFENFEVIVSDAQSKDGTDKVVDSFKKKLNIKFLEAPPKGPAYGRNQGAKAAQGEWLLFLDADDDLEEPDFIATLVNRAKSNNWATASAKVVVRNASLAERFGNWANYQYIKLLAHTKHPVAPGWCILTKRKTFEEANGYNEKIQFGEDYDYVSRVGSQGFGFVDSAHYVMDLRRARQEGIGFAIKGIKNEIYRHTHGYNLENNPNQYKFGHHKRRDK
jgi:glycosyltransferase involved in cell wall biosynthesis